MTPRDRDVMHLDTRVPCHLLRTLGLFAALTAPALAAPDPAWLLPAFPLRAVFTAAAQRGDCVVVTLPAAEAAVADPGCAAFDAAGTPVPCRIAYSDPEKMSVLVGTGAHSGERQIVVYYGAAAGTAGDHRQPDLRDANPVSADLHRPGGRSIPNAWPKMLYLYRQSGAPVSLTACPDFGDIDLVTQSSARRRRRAPGQSWLVRLQTVLLCPQEGVYRFAVGSEDASYVIMDGKVVAARPGGYLAPVEWHRGGPLALSKGVHTVEVYTFSDSPVEVRLGWGVPGGEDIVTIPRDALLAAGEIAGPRVEKRDRTLQPDFSFSLLTPYRFRGTSVVFIPVSFMNTTRNWVGGALTCQWRFDGAAGGNRDYVVHAFTGEALHTCRLEVRDELGFVGSVEKSIDARLVQPKEYPLDFEVSSLPAVCYPPDVVEPFLLIAGHAPNGYPLEVSWEVTAAGGAVQTFRQTLTLAGTPLKVPLVKAEAGALDRIAWHVRQWGSDLGTGVIRFLTPPFAAFPARVEGDRLYDSTGTQLVLVPYRKAGAFTQPAITTEQAFGTITCVDDCLAAPGLSDRAKTTTFDQVLAWLVDGPERPVVKYRALPSWESAPGAYGPLLKLVAIPAAIESDTDVAIISVGIEDILGIKDPESFERQMAAVCDMVSASRKCPVMLVTPPPFPPDANRIKPFAAAIRRVADARRIPVADIFTAFLGMQHDTSRSFFTADDLALTADGHRLAGEMIARALLAAYGEGD